MSVLPVRIRRRGHTCWSNHRPVNYGRSCQDQLVCLHLLAIPTDKGHIREIICKKSDKNYSQDHRLSWTAQDQSRLLFLQKPFPEAAVSIPQSQLWESLVSGRWGSGIQVAGPHLATQSSVWWVDDSFYLVNLCHQRNKFDHFELLFCALYFPGVHGLIYFVC